LGLTDDELASVIEVLGREPNPLELSLYAVMWSEHCSYKSRACTCAAADRRPGVLVGPR